jgi:O-antigen/teichoic acid export membrane protein
MTISTLTSGRLLVKNTIWIFATNIVSVVFAMVSIPIIIHHVGTDRFGVIGLGWALVGQFGLFEFGLGSALTKLTSERLAAQKEDDVPALFWSAFVVLLTLGFLGGVLLASLSPWLVQSVIKVPAGIRHEVLISFYLFSACIPVGISSAGLRGLLEAYQRFDLLSMLKVPVSSVSYFGPLLVIPFSHSLVPIVAVLVGGRALCWIAYLVLCFRVVPCIRRRLTVERASLKAMVRFGGWMTVTNIVSPLMVNADRFFIGAVVSVAAVSYYVTPYEAATKLFVVPGAISGVLFPAFAAAFLTDRNRAAVLFDRGLKYTFVILFPLVLGLLLFARPGLELWLGNEFADHCVSVLRLLCIGVFINSLAQIAFWQIQGAGRPDLTAKLHLIELPAYVAVFVVLTRAYGVYGAAWAWLLRVSVDALFIFLFSARLLPEAAESTRHTLLMICGAVATFALACIVPAGVPVFLFLAIVTIGFFVSTWFQLTIDERGLVTNPLKLFAQRSTNA